MGTLVITSDFGRTLTPNNQDGSDHGWGGNYFMMGGQVKGGQILGQYPDDYDGHLDAGRGRVIPTTPWDAVWYGISEWMGVKDAQKLQHCSWSSKRDSKRRIFQGRRFIQEFWCCR